MFRIRDILVYGFGSVYPDHGLTDPDPVLFVSDLQDVNKIEFFFQIFLLITF